MKKHQRHTDATTAAPGIAALHFKRRPMPAPPDSDMPGGLRGLQLWHRELLATGRIHAPSHRDMLNGWLPR